MKYTNYVLIDQVYYTIIYQMLSKLIEDVISITHVRDYICYDGNVTRMEMIGVLIISTMEEYKCRKSCLVKVN
jgi:hypothetical protein